MVFCIGYPRTGTTSMAQALCNLGFKAWHWDSGYRQAVEDVLKNKNLDQDFFNEFNAFADVPIFYVYKQLDQKYPGSKFILTTRDKDSWHDSMKRMLRCVKPEASEINRFLWKKLCADMIAEHTARVVDYLQDRSSDILIWDVKKMNYPGLAAFLKVKSLNGKFPHLNSR